MRWNKLFSLGVGLSFWQPIVADCCYEGGFEAAFLYWCASEDQLGFAIENSNLPNGNQMLAPGRASNAKIKTHHPEWDFGFRFGGYLNNDDVSYRLGWTYFQTESHDSATGSSGTPNVGIPALTGTFQNSPFLFGNSAKSTWEINVNEFIFDIEYLACTCSRLSFYPKIGIFGALINQRQNLEYAGISKVGVINGTADVAKQNRISGLGPRVGLEIEWSIWSCFNLITDFNFNYFIGQFNANNNINSSFFTGFDSIQESICRARPVITGLIGVAWSEPLGEDSGFYFSINYEFQHWFSIWHSCSNFLDNMLSGEGRWGDLQLHGLTITGGFSF